MVDAYLTGLKWLALRELSEAQVRDRLSRKEFAPDAIDDAIARLRHDRSLDDHRTAVVCARTEAGKRRGRRRVLQRLHAIGIPRDVASAAVAEVFGTLDEDSLLHEALEHRLRGARLTEASVIRRLHRFLMMQGFDAARVQAAIRLRAKTAEHDD